MNYNDGFKARMVKRLAVPGGISATALSQEVGVSQSTLSRWLREARTVPPMGGADNKREETIRPVIPHGGYPMSDIDTTNFLEQELARLLEWVRAAGVWISL